MAHTDHTDGMPKRWKIMGHDAAQIQALGRAAAISPLLAQLLLRRGVKSAEDARRFLESRLAQLRDPEALPGVSDAVPIILDHIRRGSRIVVYGDYDADGMTAVAILHEGLRRLGADVRFFVPNRLEEGYGLHPDSLRRLRQDGADLVITVDCGIGRVKEAALARSLGLDLIITDHHAAPPELPAARAIVHPGLPDKPYAFAGLCGAGVAFKLTWALCRAHGGQARVTPELRAFLVQAVGLAALGTVADVVPLVDENRILVRHGLEALHHDPPLGLAALRRRRELDRKSRLQSEDLAYSLAPRLNAAGRLGQASLGVELLTTRDPHRADQLAEYLDQLNQSRETLERRILKEARAQAEEAFDPVQDPALVLAAENWHVGVIGIVAGRLVERYHRPVVLIGGGGTPGQPAVGSARSPGGFHLAEALDACSEYLLAHGGHAAAAGLKIWPDQIDAFRAAFCEIAAATIAAEDRVAEVVIDAEAVFPQLTMNVVEQIEQLAPFGMGNPRPILCTTDVRLAEPPKRIGGGERHLSVRMEHHGVRLRGVAFGHGEWADELVRLDRPIDVAFRPVINEFRGRRSVEVHLVDWRPSGTA